MIPLIYSSKLAQLIGGDRSQNSSNFWSFYLEHRVRETSDCYKDLYFYLRSSYKSVLICKIFNKPHTFKICLLYGHPWWCRW